MAKIWTLLFVMTLAISGCSGCNPDYSNGLRSGVVVKFSKRGNLWKSWEGGLNMGGVVANGEGALSPNVWDFSVVEPAAIDQVRRAMESGQRVTLVYRQWSIGPSTIDTEYEVSEVRGLPDGGAR